MSQVQIIPFKTEHRSAVVRILTAIGWAEQYVTAAAENAVTFSQNPETLAAYAAQLNGEVVGFIYVKYAAWNQLTQIEGLAVDPAHHRKGVALALVRQAEAFAREKQARGIYVDTPTTNQRGRAFYEAAGYLFGYIMPRYYEDQLDGVTYQKFFTG
ncbi:MAG: GNAT family N-acetyltransferase [Chloroflexi bacterium]|nr:GNAT family N-acetyltransferase [Chloroflexota bacterium]MCC6894814.1 GNAT family N-acetyltransferase [Anaerolineae bacterium]